MSWFKRERKMSAVEAEDVGCGSFDTQVVGESQYQAAIARAAAASTERADGYPVIFVGLVREPDNKFDSNAVQVHASSIGVVGYLERSRAAEWAPFLDRLARKGEHAACRAIIIGGPERKRESYGVVLDLDQDYLDSSGRRKGNR